MLAQGHGNVEYHEWVVTLANDIRDLGEEMRTIYGFGITINQHHGCLSIGESERVVEVLVIEPCNFDGMVANGVSKTVGSNQFYGALVIFIGGRGRV